MEKYWVIFFSISVEMWLPCSDVQLPGYITLPGVDPSLWVNFPGSFFAGRQIFLKYNGLLFFLLLFLFSRNCPRKKVVCPGTRVIYPGSFTSGLGSDISLYPNLLNRPPNVIDQNIHPQQSRKERHWLYNLREEIRMITMITSYKWNENVRNEQWC